MNGAETNKKIPNLKTIKAISSLFLKLIILKSFMKFIYRFNILNYSFIIIWDRFSYIIIKQTL